MLNLYTIVSLCNLQRFCIVQNTTTLTLYYRDKHHAGFAFIYVWVYFDEMYIRTLYKNYKQIVDGIVINFRYAFACGMYVNYLFCPSHVVARLVFGMMVCWIYEPRACLRKRDLCHHRLASILNACAPALFSQHIKYLNKSRINQNSRI